MLKGTSARRLHFHKENLGQILICNIFLKIKGTCKVNGDTKLTISDRCLSTFSNDPQINLLLLLLSLLKLIEMHTFFINRNDILPLNKHINITLVRQIIYRRCYKRYMILFVCFYLLICFVSVLLFFLYLTNIKEAITE